MSGGLTEPMRDMLARVCATNGGGLSAYNEPRATVKALQRRGLVQGKAGQAWRIVHTREGMRLNHSLLTGGGE